MWFSNRTLGVRFVVYKVRRANVWIPKREKIEIATIKVQLGCTFKDYDQSEVNTTLGVAFIFKNRFVRKAK